MDLFFLYVVAAAALLLQAAAATAAAPPLCMHGDVEHILLNSCTIERRLLQKSRLKIPCLMILVYL